MGCILKNIFSKISKSFLPQHSIELHDMILYPFVKVPLIIIAKKSIMKIQTINAWFLTPETWVALDTCYQLTPSELTFAKRSACTFYQTDPKFA